MKNNYITDDLGFSGFGFVTMYFALKHIMFGNKNKAAINSNNN